MTRSELEAMSRGVTKALRPLLFHLQSRIEAHDRALEMSTVVPTLPRCAECREGDYTAPVAGAKPRIAHRGEWTSDREYRLGDGVVYNGHMFEARLNNLQSHPQEDPVGWRRMW